MHTTCTPVWRSKLMTIWALLINANKVLVLQVAGKVDVESYMHVESYTCLLPYWWWSSRQYEYRAKLQTAGLGEKKVPLFLYGCSDELNDELLDHSPKFFNGGVMSCWGRGKVNTWIVSQSHNTDYVTLYKAVLQTVHRTILQNLKLFLKCVLALVFFLNSRSRNAGDHAWTEASLSKCTNWETWDWLSVCELVDGSGDEGPIHEDIQILWTVQHLEKETIAVTVTTRSSGSNYLNRVEL